MDAEEFLNIDEASMALLNVALSRDIFDAEVSLNIFLADGIFLKDAVPRLIVLNLLFSKADSAFVTASPLSVDRSMS